MIRAAFLRTSDAAYTRLLRPLIFRSSAQTAHERMMRLLRLLDGTPGASMLLDGVRRAAAPDGPVRAGGVVLAAPLILAAGLVKGDGFASEDAALAAVRAGRNIIPGWRSVPAMVGLVEFGSFTRWPRLGNPGVVVWRDVATRSTQNRVGLRNPGACAAAEFLAAQRTHLPSQFGINIAVSPGVDDPDRQAEEVLGALAAFVERGAWPTWFTLNLSCPNTEDDPTGNQTAEGARTLCRAATNYLKENGRGVLQYAPTAYDQNARSAAIPLWVKIGPNLSAEQIAALMAVFAETGVRAVVSTNTLPMPAPTDASLMAGVGGGRLHDAALQTTAALVRANAEQGSAVDVIGCGGVLDGSTYRDFVQLGVLAVQYWSALVYRGPLAAALIAREAKP